MESIDQNLVALFGEIEKAELNYIRFTQEEYAKTYQDTPQYARQDRLMACTKDAVRFLSIMLRVAHSMDGSMEFRMRLSNTDPVELAHAYLISQGDEP